MARGATAAAAVGSAPQRVEFARRGGECACAAAGLGNSGLGLRRHAGGARRRAPGPARGPARPAARAGFRRRRRRLRRAPRADRLRSSPAGRPHGRACCEPPRANPGCGGRVSVWLKRMSDNSRLTISSKAGIGCGSGAAALRVLVGQRGKRSRAGLRGDAGCPAARPRPARDRRSRWSLEASSRSSRYDTRCSRWAKAAALSLPTGMRSMRSDSARSAPSRCSVLVGRRRPFAAFQRRGQRRDALFEHRKGIAVVVGAAELVDLGRQQCGRRRTAGPARRWRRHWRRWREAPRWRLRAAARWRDRRWRAGSGRAWRRDCGSPRHSRRAAPPASASAALRGFR